MYKLKLVRDGQILLADKSNDWEVILWVELPLHVLMAGTFWFLEWMSLHSSDPNRAATNRSEIIYTLPFSFNVLLHS